MSCRCGAYLLMTRKREDATAAATAAAAQLPLDAPRRLRHKLAYDARDWTFVRQAQLLCPQLTLFV